MVFRASIARQALIQTFSEPHLNLSASPVQQDLIRSALLQAALTALLATTHIRLGLQAAPPVLPAVSKTKCVKHPVKTAPPELFR